VNPAPTTLAPAVPGAARPTAPSPAGTGGKSRFLLLCLASLGIVYGDIGTSPLYALRECFYGVHAIPPTPPNVLGVLSLILWSLILIISVKYLILILRADNRSEGGILALATLVSEVAGRAKFLMLLGLFGAALLYADGMITPAISVLSAVEGLHVATPLFDPYVLPVATGILIGLFIFQSRGTTGVGRVFGPVTVLWFVAIALLGIQQIVRVPEVLGAINPLQAFQFFIRNGGSGFVVLGAVFLVVTGGEALYADIGHFGTRPIRATWFAVVLPALTLNYFGQGALLLANPDAAANPFFNMAPAWALYPMVVLAAAAAVIASQAMISGAYSLTLQAIQLGYMPRLRVHYTSERVMGQIYVPVVNWALMLSSIGLVLGFGTSSNLAAAYGVAITTTMLITTILFYVVARRRWHWPAAAAIPVVAFFIIIDFAFFGANMIKIAQGGWFPLSSPRPFFSSCSLGEKAVEFCASVSATSACRSMPFSQASKTKASAVCPAPRFTCQAIAPARPSRCCIISGTTKCCTSKSSYSPSAPKKSPSLLTPGTALRSRNWRRVSGGCRFISVSWRSRMSLLRSGA